jgi:hypothetical protein
LNFVLKNFRRKPVRIDEEGEPDGILKTRRKAAQIYTYREIAQSRS